VLEPTALRPRRRRLLARGVLWHYARQRQVVVALFVAGFVVAMLDTTILFHRTGGDAGLHPSAGEPAARGAPQLLGMAAVVLLLRPAALLIQAVITNQAIAPGPHQP